MLKYSSDKNELYVFHNKKSKRDALWINFNQRKINVFDKNIDFSTTGLNIAIDKEGSNEFLGVKISAFLEPDGTQIKGVKAEEKFKDLLERNNIPCLYVGQGVNFQERNAAITYCGNEITIKRPDYLVSFPEIGNILIDVKCRKRVKFPHAKNNIAVFYLNYKDLDNLYDLRNYLNLPVWIAFIDSDDEEFYLCQIKVLKEIRDEFKRKYKGILNTKHLRIPDDILIKLSDSNFISNLSNFKLDYFVNSLIKFEMDYLPLSNKDMFIKDEYND